MKKLFLILGMFLFVEPTAKAEIYHGIDIDAVYTSSDWNSKEDIIKLIDDYTLLLQFENKSHLCSNEAKKLHCMDKLVEDIITHFYVGDAANNLNNYHNYIRAASTAYGAIYCLNKYSVPAGTMCHQENSAHTLKITEEYINEMLQQIRQIISEYSFIQSYKDLAGNNIDKQKFVNPIFYQPLRPRSIHSGYIYNTDIY